MDNRAANHALPLFFALVVAGCTSVPRSSPTLYYDPETGVVADELGLELFRKEQELNQQSIIDKSTLTHQKEVSTASDMENIAYIDKVTETSLRGNQDDQQISREEVMGISSHDTSNSVISRDNLNIFILGIIAVLFFSRIVLAGIAKR